MAKRAILDGLALPLDEAVKVEAEQFGACFATDDCRTGVQSFMENGPGKATFSGR
jgi:enoyl-CoA hydratase/carnithine racemase